MEPRKKTKGPLQTFQGYKCRKILADGIHQAVSASVKIELIPQTNLPGQGSLGGIKADPENECLQPAHDTAEDAPSSKPDAGRRRNPGRSAAAAGIAKRVKSEAEEAPFEPPAKRSRTRKLPKAGPAQLTAARQPKQQPSNPAVKVNEVIYADVKRDAASYPDGEQAQLGGQEAQTVLINGSEHEDPAEQARRFGNLVGEGPQRIIIGGENPSAWAKGRTKPRPYKGPGNTLWPILKRGKIVAATADRGDERKMLDQIGFMDIGLATWPSGIAPTEVGGKFRTPGGKNSTEWLERHAPAFYARLHEHMVHLWRVRGASVFVWNGKTAWKKLLKISGIRGQALKAIKCGPQTIKPKDWPLLEQTRVYMMPSTSGSNKAHFANDRGRAAWKALGKDMRLTFAARKWPFKPTCY